jgi:hypothetical protein
VVSDLLCVIYSTLPFDSQLMAIAVKLIEILAMHSNIQKPIKLGLYRQFQIFFGMGA